MNTQIRRLGIGLIVCFIALFVQLNVIQVVKADQYNSNPLNNREVIADFSRQRGFIQTADGKIAAESIPSGDRYDLLRRYPLGDLFAHSVGYFSLTYGTSGTEQSYNDLLAGRSRNERARGIAGLFANDSSDIADLTLTLRADLQQVAKDALGPRNGAVVAIDPRTGAILALWSYPSFDPNTIATHNTEAAKAARESLLLAPGKPLLAATYQERYFPGSTYKVVTASAGLESGQVTPEAPVYPTSNQYIPPGTTNPIKNFGGTTCGGNLAEILRVSCNTAFAQIGVDLGALIMRDRATAFGFDQPVPFDLPRPAQSTYPTLAALVRDSPKLAQTAFGQNDVQATPMMMAMVAGAVANGGTIMQPHVLQEVRNTRGEVIQRYQPRPWLGAMSPSVAAILSADLVNVVQNGTAKNLAIPGVNVGGKTGTAQLGTTPPSSHAWILGFAPAEAPRIAVAVIVTAQPGVSEITGGAVAAPIARAVIAKLLSLNLP